MTTKYLLNAVITTGAGTSLALNNTSLTNMCQYPIAISGVVGDTIRLEVSFDNVTFVPLAEGEFTTSVATVLTCPFNYIRANVTTRSTGTITVVIGEV
jgi:hypothetical protein